MTAGRELLALALRAAIFIAIIGGIVLLAGG
jgi:hypothetical protein